MADLIDRQEAIHAIEFGIRYVKAFNKDTGEIRELFQKENEELREAVERVRELPSAQPEQKIGHWIPILRDSENDEYRCSACSQPMGFDYDYCPHCGARMIHTPTYPSNSIN